MTKRFAILSLISIGIAFTACKKENDTNPGLRDRIDYASLRANTDYYTSFKDRQGGKTVVNDESILAVDMLLQLDGYMKTVTTTSPAPLVEARLKAMFTNTGAPFTGNTLNGLSLSLRQRTAESAANAEEMRAEIENRMATLAAASQSVTEAAAPGNAGRTGKYLLDNNGVEQGQFIQKALMGAFQVDQIANVLLSDAALQADNSILVSGKNYTALEHTWDLAFGYLTANPVFAGTDSNGAIKERFLGSYILEMNGGAAPAIHIAFLKGRAAIANKDITTMKAQATIIQTELEKTLAKAALAYVDVEVREATDPAVRMHALSEGLGFVYALRFCKSKYGVDAAWSEGVLNQLLSGPDAAWSVDNAKLDAAASAIRAKFSL